MKKRPRPSAPIIDDPPQIPAALTTVEAQLFADEAAHQIYGLPCREAVYTLLDRATPFHSTADGLFRVLRVFLKEAEPSCVSDMRRQIKAFQVGV